MARTNQEIVDFVLTEMYSVLADGYSHFPRYMIDAAELIGFIEGKSRDEVRHEHPQRFDVDDAELYGL